MSESTQTTVFGEELDSQLTIETTGRVIRPFKQMVEQIIKPSRSRDTEYRLEFVEEGIHVQMVDSANVIMIDATLHKEGLDTYELSNEFNIGVSNGILGPVVQHARYGVSTDDEIRLDVSEEEIESEVTRDLHGVEATFTERSAVIDEKSIRERPELPELDFSVSVDIPVRTWIDVIDALDTEYVNLVADNGLAFMRETDIANTHVELDVPTSEKAESLYSMSYLEKISKALHVGKVDEITDLRFSDEFPLMLDFEREDMYSGTIMVAPRIQTND